MKTLTQFLEAHNFLVKGHTKKQLTLEDQDFYKKCISCIGVENNAIIKDFIDLMDSLYNERWEDLEPEDLPNNESEAEKSYFYYDLEDITERSNWYFRAFHNALSAIRGSQKEKRAIINIICWQYINFKNNSK